MSIKLIAMTLEADLGTVARKAVMLKLADCANDQGSHCYPSIDTIARQTHLSRRTVQRVLREFVDDGLVAVTEPGGGRFKTTNYAINVRRLFDLAPDEKGDTLSPFAGTEPEPNSDTLSPLATERVTPCRETVTLTTETVTPCHPNRYNRQEPTQCAREPDGDGQGGETSPDGDPHEPFDEFWTASKPKQTRRAETRVVFDKLIAEGVKPRVLIDAMAGQRKRENAAATEFRYLAAPYAFLADRRFEADDGKAMKKPAAKPWQGEVFVDAGSTGWREWQRWLFEQGLTAPKAIQSASGFGRHMARPYPPDMRPKGKRGGTWERVEESAA